MQTEALNHLLGTPAVPLPVLDVMEADMACAENGRVRRSCRRCHLRVHQPEPDQDLQDPVRPCRALPSPPLLLLLELLLELPASPAADLTWPCLPALQAPVTLPGAFLLTALSGAQV